MVALFLKSFIAGINLFPERRKILLVYQIAKAFDGALP